MNTNGTMVTPAGIAVALAVVLALGFLFLGPSLFAPFEPESEQATLEGTENTLMITDVTEGTGEAVVPGMRVTVNYVGTLENGQVFDASANHGGTFSFVLGVDRVIEGWQQGLIGMKEGGVRRLVIPPEMGYGNRATGAIPANSTLIFDIELLSVDSVE